jgi:hypothetical protein
MFFDELCPSKVTGGKANFVGGAGLGGGAGYRSGKRRLVMPPVFEFAKPIANS